MYCRGRTVDVYVKHEISRLLLICLLADSDNDLVAFSSDEELIEALGFVNDGIFRIHIREKTFGGSGPQNGHKHPGVVCDVCNSEIYGSRFKCIECPDYDLCCTCEGRGEHSDHRMIRTRNPAAHMGMPPFVSQFLFDLSPHPLPTCSPSSLQHILYFTHLTLKCLFIE